MADRLALEQLFDSVVAEFANKGYDVEQTFGWREMARTAESPRIVWIPGDPDGEFGELQPAALPGRNPKSLGTLLETFHVVISTYDPDPQQMEIERAQWRAARLLFDAWWRAVYKVMHGQVTIVEGEWGTVAGFRSANPRHERRLGEALRITCAVASAIPDTADAELPFGARGLVTVDLLNVTETMETEPPALLVDVATTGNISLFGTQGIDAYPAGSISTVLAWQQTDQKQNGLYQASSGVWSRSPTPPITGGLFVGVLHGATYAQHGFIQRTPDPIVIGTSLIVFEHLGPTG